MSINVGREIGRDNTNVFRRQYVGEVIDVDDPKKLQRVKIRIRELHRGLSDEEIPWSARGPGWGQGHGGGMGSQSIPQKGAKMSISFMDNTPYYPQYSGAPDSEDTKLKDEDFTKDDNYKHVHGHIDAGGNKMLVNTKEGSEHIEYQHKTGSSWQMDKDGGFNISGAKNVNASAQGDAKVTAKGAAEVHGATAKVVSGGDLDLSGKGTINIAGGSTINLKAGAINLIGTVKSSTPVTLGAAGGKSPSDPAKPNAVKGRDRPKVESKANNKDY